ncbi:hypothetical protein AB1L42_19305 [Thalassoglobus sp. JC818]|uniref:hypothetical protein n=1 Tax=Thalassoglobus sp. JC818 TaxID=3232136 RepID=UPI003457E1E7
MTDFEGVLITPGQRVEWVPGERLERYQEHLRKAASGDLDAQLECERLNPGGPSAVDRDILEFQHLETQIALCAGDLAKIQKQSDRAERALEKAQDEYYEAEKRLQEAQTAARKLHTEQNRIKQERDAFRSMKTSSQLHVSEMFPTQFEEDE